MSTIASVADGLRLLVRLIVPPPPDPPRFDNEPSCGRGRSWERGGILNMRWRNGPVLDCPKQESTTDISLAADDFVASAAW